jgi:predicted O-methyltransferase YrrM
MNDLDAIAAPRALPGILADTERAGFTMASELRTGAFLRALAASKPGGRILELGTGTGVGTSWLLHGMDARATLDTVDTDAAMVESARRHLEHDPRVRFHVEDGGAYLERAQTGSFDLVYADAWPGKFSHLDLALSTVAPGGIYFIDDLVPQPNWQDGHAARVASLLSELDGRRGFVAVRLSWSTGLMMMVRRPTV